MNRLSVFLRSRLFTALIIGFGLLALLASVFALGLLTGYRKASLAYNGGGQFYRLFGAPSERIGSSSLPVPLPQDFSGGFGNDHGASGTIIGVSSSTVTIEDISHTEISVNILPETIIREGRDTLSLGEIKPGQTAVIFGDNSNGKLNAELIRIIPSQVIQ